jgi:regulatory protein
MQNNQTKIRIPKKITLKRLENIALHYLSRYESSSENLRKILKRRVYKASKHHETNTNQANEWIEQIIDKMQRLEYINDDRYALNQLRRLWEKGASKRKMQAHLAQKGIPLEKITDILQNFMDSLDIDDNFELIAAKKHAKRKKIGIYRQKNQREDYRNKDLAAMARAGFSYEIAKKIID